MKKAFIPQLLAACLMLVMLTACGGDATEASTGETGESEPLKSEPIGEVNQAVNEIPNEQFNKPAQVEVNASVQVPENNLVEAQTALPEKVDAILSRESIVIFSQKIMMQMPDETEFSQVKQQRFTGPNGWNAFAARYVTRNSKMNMVIFGAYDSKGQIYWGSDLGGMPTDFSLTAIEPMDGGAKLYGNMEDGTKFSAELSKQSLKISRATNPSVPG